MPADEHTQDLQFSSEHALKAIYALTIQIADTCFDKCITKLYPKMDAGDAECVTQCTTTVLNVKSFLINQLMSLTAGQELASLIRQVDPK
jgi:hypothetical protein